MAAGHAKRTAEKQITRAIRHHHYKRSVIESLSSGGDSDGDFSISFQEDSKIFDLFGCRGDILPERNERIQIIITNRKRKKEYDERNPIRNLAARWTNDANCRAERIKTFTEGPSFCLSFLSIYRLFNDLLSFSLSFYLVTMFNCKYKCWCRTVSLATVI